MPVANSFVRWLCSIHVFGQLSLLSGVLAIAMDIYLFCYDRHHSTDPVLLSMGHLLNTGFWFVLFAFGVFLMYGLFQLILNMVRRLRKLHSRQPNK